MKMTVKTGAKTPLKNPPKMGPKSHHRVRHAGQIFCQTTSRGRGTFKEERLNFVQFLK